MNNVSVGMMHKSRMYYVFEGVCSFNTQKGMKVETKSSMHTHLPFFLEN